MPPTEGRALHRAACAAPPGPLLEIGTYCGKSAIYLGAAAAARDAVVVTVDHHRGSEEHQPGWGYHDPDLVDPATGELDTLPCFRRTIHDAGLEDVVIAVVGDSPQVAAVWSTPLALVFVDGGHTEEAARADFESWAPHLVDGGLLVIHDVFEDPADGGRAPYRTWRRAVDSGAFRPVSSTGSLRVGERDGEVPL